MAVILDSTRLGSVETLEEAEIEFPYGLIGLPGTRYALVAASEQAPFLRLHSLEDGGPVIPVTNPFRFFDGYEIELSDDEAARTGISASDDIAIYVTVRAGSARQELTANLRAPLLVSGGRGHQVINQSSQAPLIAPLFGTTVGTRPVAGTLASFDPVSKEESLCSSSPGVPARRSCSATTLSSR